MVHHAAFRTRFLNRLAIENIVVDAASIKVNRRAKRVKSDRVDAEGLVLDLIRHHRGEKGIWKVVRVPTEGEEDQRRRHRMLERLKKERTQHRARILSLLATQGIRPERLKVFVKELGQARTWQGKSLPPELMAEIEQQKERLWVVERQMKEIGREQEEAVRNASSVAQRKVARLCMLRGVGIDTAWMLVMEFFGWREFRNRREVGGAAGLGGTPYSSGVTRREQGISKAGNRWVRARMIELGWIWLRLQPQAELSQWFVKRFGDGGARMRRVGIVALARRLLIELWHFVEHGVVPRGAVLKSERGAIGENAVGGS